MTTTFATHAGMRPEQFADKIDARLEQIGQAPALRDEYEPLYRDGISISVAVAMIVFGRSVRP